MLDTILPLILPDYISRAAIQGPYLYYNPGATYTLPNGFSYADRISTGSLIAICKEWAQTNHYVMLSGTTDLGEYICYYDHIPSYPRDYFIDQYDYTTNTNELLAVLSACEAIYSHLLDIQ